MRIAFCSSEVFPFAKTGGLADVCGALPLALENIGIKVDIFLPKYKCVDNADYSIEEINEGLFHTVIGKNVDVYFIANNDYFDRDGLYGDASGDYSDNLERYKYFSENILIALKKLKIKPDVMHCNDWQTALVPVLLKEKYSEDKSFNEIKSILTIHNLAYQGVFSGDDYKKLGLRNNLSDHPEFEFWGKTNLLKAGIIYSDQVTTVSSQYAKEILTKHFGCGLEDVLLAKKDEIVGIINGLDHKVWDPQIDEFIFKKYSLENFKEEKILNKKCIQEKVGFHSSGRIPLFGFVGRLSHQKGIDLIINSIEDIVKHNIQIIIQGIGDKRYQNQLKKIHDKYPDKIYVFFKFDENLAHQIYAGSDMFLMPSNFEPCGLSQMISFRYGTIPLVFKTGGLADTVIDSSSEFGNGFVFDHYNKKSFISAFERAVEVFNNKDKFNLIIKNAFASEFPWDNSAEKYKNLYKCLLSGLQVV